MTTFHLPESRLSRLSDLVATEMGLNFPRSHWQDLERALFGAATELGYENLDPYLQSLEGFSSPRRQWETLASHLTVGETYFFREKKSFEALRERILPDLIDASRRRDRQLRIWSAGCCTGEEPYSIAILLDQLLPDIHQWHITILATDLNPRFLHKARLGRYTQWSFRDAPPWVLERYFTRTQDGAFEVSPGIRQKVTFAYLNLAEDVYPSLTNGTNAMDAVFCRNVIMYFTVEQARKSIQKFYRSLVQGGWLIVSPTETSQALFPEFAPVNVSGVTLYQKDGVKGSGPAKAEVRAFPSWSDSCPARLTNPDPISSARPEPSPPPVPNLPDPAVPPRDHRVESGAHPGPAPEEIRARAACGEAAPDECPAKPADEPQKAASDYSHTPAAMTALARSRANEGNLREAKSWAEQAIAADKLNPQLHYLRAVILQELGELDEANAALNRALYLDPEFVLAHFSLGHLFLHRENPRSASRCFANAASLLNRLKQEEVLPESEGITVGRLREIVAACVDVAGENR